MSNPSAFGFGKFVPGFDFLQNLAQSTGKATAPSGIPGMSSWVAPTLSVEEIDKRIQELKTVQFWLEQNGTALKATIQALEVQKMTLSTLQSMNVNMADLAKAFTVKPAPVKPSPAAPTAAPEAPPREPQETQAQASADSPAKSGVDPMAWWGSLTQQFQNIATSAMNDVAAQAIQARPPKPAAKKAPRKAASKTSRTAASSSTRKR